MSHVIPALSPVTGVVKRGFDLLAATVLLALLSPLLLLLALCVRLSSSGPILFRQERVGLGGQRFSILKFRSMRVTSGGLSVTSSGDSRITPVGKRLRQWKLDELPQLWNVVTGEMSLVGPRPEVPTYLRYYTPEQREVLAIRPGITGISQLEFRDEEALLAGQTDVETYYIRSVLPAKLALDLRYVQDHSFSGDIALLLRTIAIMVR